MPVDKKRLDYLFQRYVEKRCTQQEMLELFEFIKCDENRDIIARCIDGQIAHADSDTINQEIDWDTIYQSVTQIHPKSRVQTFISWRMIFAAASILLIFSLGLYYFFEKESGSALTNIKQSGQDIAPGTNKAVLTLGDGSTIILDQVSNGIIASQGGTSIKKAENGNLVYDVTAGNSSSNALNTISTPRGGQYKIILPDGTKVWLNAASSIRFPAAFSGNERHVELSGEAYFEVMKNAAMPFRVLVRNKANIEVLGTHFNIMAYPDEDEIKTTLAEGSVKVANPLGTTILVPGQEAVMPTSGTGKIKVREADLDQSLAWKNGLFHFENAELSAVMRQIARWYDVDVIYTGAVPEGHYRGKVSRYSNVSSLLKILELSGINFTIEEGRKIIVKIK